MRYKDLLPSLNLNIDFSEIRIIGEGENGEAYKLKNGNVLKVTESKTEASVIEKFVGKNSEHIADIYSFYKIRENLFVYELEFLYVYWSQDDNKLFERLVYLFDRTNNFIKWNEFINSNYESKLIKLNEIGETIGNGDINPTEERILFFTDGLKDILKEIYSNGITAMELDMDIDNFGIKNDSLAVFDFLGI